MKLVRGGDRRRNCSANLTENLISAFLSLGEEDVWQISLERVTERKRNFLIKRRRKQRDARAKEIRTRCHKHAAKTRNDWAKLLTNDGELIPAFATMVSRGVAPFAVDIPKQLKAQLLSLKS